MIVPMKLGSHTRCRHRCAVVTLLMLFSLVLAGTVQAQEQTGSDFSVLHYVARIDPDLAAKTLRGDERITVQSAAMGVKNLSFDAGGLVIDEVWQGGQKLSFQKVGKRLDIDLPAALKFGERADIEIAYHGAPTFGLEFHPEVNEIYTIFSTSQWLVCLDSPGQRATLDLSVTLPAGFKAIGNGRLVSKSSLNSQQDIYHWQQNTPVPSFVYGFAAGKFNELDTRQSGVPLRFLSQDLSADQLRKVFQDTGDILQFFGSRAGVPYQGKYDEALVTETIGQEHASFALMSEAYGASTLQQQQGEDLIAHEAAHQWWGIMVTCRSWSDFWLNEGFADFMAAAYIQHRFGDTAYQQIVDGWHQRVQRLQDAGKDHSLVYQQWNHPTKDDRAVVYKKGAYVLSLLRLELGDKAFWKGIQDYTREYGGKSVTTKDFETAMEQSSGRNLNDFFQKWIDGPSSSSVPVAVATPKTGMH